jgi:thymidylate synthase (FAD)
MKVALKSITPNAETNIVEIARVSSSRTDKTEKPEGLINYLIKNKHWSPFEHSYITFEIETSKAIGIQLLRHVSFRFQEFSQRYAKVEGIEPIEFRLQTEKNRQSSTDVVGIVFQTENGDIFAPDAVDPKFDQLMLKTAKVLSDVRALYLELIEAGIAKECARFVLPMATSTKIYMTGSIRSWIHCLEIRDDAHAQKEVQLIAKDIKSLFIKELPIISNALGWVPRCENIVDSLVDAINDAKIFTLSGQVIATKIDQNGKDTKSRGEESP